MRETHKRPMSLQKEHHTARLQNAARTRAVKTATPYVTEEVNWVREKQINT